MWNLKKYGGRAAMTDDRGNMLTYEELDAIQHSIADAITADGNTRPLVFILCSNIIECVEGYAACIQNHIPSFLLTEGISENMFEKLCKAYLPEYLWTPVGKVNRGKRIYRHMGYELVKLYDSTVPVHDSLALLLSTSGTTGSRKTVRISYENIESNTKAIIEALSIRATDRAATMLPMHYTYGLSVVNTHLYVGAGLLVTNKKAFSREFWEFFCRNRGTTVSGVAYTYKMLKKLGFDRWELPSLRKMTQAGERLSLELYHYLTDMAEKREIDFRPMYGQTEATARIAVMPAGMAGQKIGSVGLPLEGGAIELLDDKGQRIKKPYIKGKLIYTGKNVAMGYAEEREDLSEGDNWKGRLDTGDYAYMDEEGYLFVTGRKDEYVKVAGNRVSMQELETMLEGEFPEGEFCVGYADEKIKVAGTVKDVNAVSEWLGRITGLNRRMVEVKYCDVIPLSDTGKVNRKLYDRESGKSGERLCGER